VSAAADSYTQLAMLHAAENAKSFEEVRSTAGDTTAKPLLPLVGP
jgi:hypothetical protein